jgi:hypothetical protein
LLAVLTTVAVLVEIRLSPRGRLPLTTVDGTVRL